MGQNGKVTSTNTPPFATADGKPTTVSDATPTNFNKNATSEAQKGGEQLSPQPDGDNVIVSRRQSTEAPSEQPPDAPHLRSRAQQSTGTAAQRVNPKTIPDGGTVPPMSTGMRPGVQPASGARSPFKNMK